MFVFNPSMMSTADEEGADDTVYTREDSDEDDGEDGETREVSGEMHNMYMGGGVVV